MTPTAWKQRLAILLVLVATWIAYLPALQGGFVWDDYDYLVENQALRSLDGLLRIWLDPRATIQYYPLVFSSFWVEYQIWQLQPLGYHAVNILLHSVNALLVWRLLRKLSLPGAWLAAMIFALHPVHVESVAWIMERKNVLSGLFYLSAALSYLRFRSLDAEPSSAPIRFYALALLLFAGAMFSKTVTASLPAALLLVLYWKTGRVSVRDVALLLPFFVVGVAGGLHTAWLERVQVGASGVEWSFSFLERWLIATRALCFYPAKLLWPTPLIFTYPRWEIDATEWWQYLFGLAVTGCVLLLWLGRRRIGRGPLVSALFFAGTLFPALGFIDVYPMRFSFVADHFQYLASLGVIAPFAAGATHVCTAIAKRHPGPPRLLGPAAIAVVLVALASQTFLQSQVYRDEETVWRDTLSKNPSSWMAHNNLGRILGFRNETGQAVQHFRRAVELKEDYYVAETNLAEALTRLGEHGEAVDHLRHVLAIAPDYADAHYFLWVALGNLGRWDEAVYHLRRGRALVPSFRGHIGAARLLRRAGRRRDALRELEEAEKFRPGSAVAAFERGNVYLELNQPQQAAAAFHAALLAHPGWARAQNKLGLALERLGDPEQAAEHYAEAVRLNPRLEPARRNLARLRAQGPGSTIGEQP